MPFFKTTFNILNKNDEDELYDESWMESYSLILPETKNWDYSRELSVDDIDIWEVIYEASDGIGVYAAYRPYAEMYMITIGFDSSVDPRIYGDFLYPHKIVETYYGKNAQKMVQERMIQLGIPFSTNYIWVENEDMWMYE
jgi:hypothetical protein